MLFDLNDHFLNHFLHFFDLWGYLNNIMLHLGVLQDTLRTEHAPIVLAIELDFLLRMDFTISDWIGRRFGFASVTGACCILNTHWEGS